MNNKEINVLGNILRRKLGFAVLIIIATVISILFDYFKSILRDYAGRTFNFTPGILFLISANLTITVLFVLIINHVKYIKPSPIMAIFLVALGIVLNIFPLTYLPSLDFILPYLSLHINYLNIAGSLWLILGIYISIHRSND